MEPYIMEYCDFEESVQRRHHLHFQNKNLADGSVMSWYIACLPKGLNCIVFGKTVYGFEEFSEASKFFTNTKVAPAGFAKYNYDIRLKYLDETLDLNYKLITYEFFLRHRMNRTDVRVISENILDDGRMSVLFAQLSYNRGVDPKKYYLMIGRMVFVDWRLEVLKKLEFAINDGSAVYWRPELSGKIDNPAAYTVNIFKEAYHKKLINNGTFFKSVIMPGGLIAGIYKSISKVPRFYMRLADKIYAFGCQADCEIIIKELMSAPVYELPDEDRNSILLLESLRIAALRIGRYMSADIYTWTFDTTMKVDTNGSLTGLPVSI